jgi:hypothetical protein
LLGQQHLQVLRTLKQAGHPVKDGLHRTAPYGMVNQGFADSTAEGYVLSSKGESVLYLYDDVTADERELLMRMYRAHQDKRGFTIEEDAAQCADNLIRVGLIDINVDCLILTNYALDVWDGWVQFWDLKHQKHAATQKLKKAEAKAQAPVVNGTSSGAVPRGKYQSSRPTERDNEALPVELEAAPPPLAVNSACVDDCDSCIDREVLKLISTKYPKIAALRDSMLEQRRILKELGL